jgi:hypothetical protein
VVIVVLLFANCCRASVVNYNYVVDRSLVDRLRQIVRTSETLPPPPTETEIEELTQAGQDVRRIDFP